MTSAVGDLRLEDFTNRKKIKAGGDFEIMGCQHKNWPIYGIQFHPESFATEGGKETDSEFSLPLLESLVALGVPNSGARCVHDF